MAKTTIRGLQERKYNSGNQVIVAGGLLTLAHGLGVVPDKIEVNLVNVVADQGYAIGDITPCLMDTTNNRGHALTKDATNIYIRFASAVKTYPIIIKNTGAGNQITNVNWRVTVKAEA